MRRYPLEPPKVEEIITVMRAVGNSDHGAGLRALIAISLQANHRAPIRSIVPRPIWTQRAARS